jgi:hypothetical protein
MHQYTSFKENIINEICHTPRVYEPDAELSRIVDYLVAATAAATSKYIQSMDKSNKARAHRQIVDVFNLSIKEFSHKTNPLFFVEDGEDLFRSEIEELKEKETSDLMIEIGKHFTAAGDVYGYLNTEALKRKAGKNNTVIAFDPLDNEHIYCFKQTLISRLEGMENAHCLVAEAYKVKALARVLKLRLIGELSAEERANDGN